MDTTQLPQAVDDWLAMLDQVGISIGKVLADVDAREPLEDHTEPRNIQPTLKRSFNRLDQRLEKLTARLDEAGHTAAEVSEELAAAEESLRGWVDEVAVIAGRMTLTDDTGDQ